MSDLLAVHVPSISISPAPPEEPLVEPYSPFSTCLTPTLSEDDAFRPQHLTPPPTHTGFGRQLSPLRPAEATVKGKGLERERFEALLQASRERNAALGSKKSQDLRKEIALKAHKNKQVERRALFLSKVLAPPSPTATITPKTPPESPAIFHYTLPSPGLESPLALFETLNEDPARGPCTTRKAWVEQVDFRLPGQDHKEKPSGQTIFSAGTAVRKGPRVLPSLDQITARLNSQRHASLPIAGEAVPAPAPAPAPARPARLPAFLTRKSAPKVAATDERSNPPTIVGRLKMPVRAPQPAKVDEKPFLPPKSPMSLLPKIQVTTLVVPRSNTISPTALSEINLLALDSRERKAQDMLSTLRRRTLISDHGYNGHDTDMTDERKMKWKRHSAPGDLGPLCERSGFEHPVLALPGGF